jgi:hypothetical protein
VQINPDFLVMLRIVFLIVLLSPVPALGTPLFDSHDVIEVRLTGPLTAVFEDTEEREYKPFTLESGGVSLPLKVRLRGHSRVRVCDFPPLKLNFPEDLAPGTVFYGQDKLKLVTHCRNHERGEQDLLEEYAAYRIFNLLSDVSYRVRLLNIHYVDSQGQLDKDASPRHAFVMESREELAERLGAEPVTLKGLPRYRHDLDQAALIYVFEYLIGNTDFGLVRPDYEEGCCHNIDLLEMDGQVITVPYDFDLAGLVNAQYAFPDPSLRIKRVTQRLYQGLCTDPDILRSAIRRVQAQRATILETVRDIPGMSASNAKRALKYLDRYFKKAEDEDGLMRGFERHCRGDD